MCYQHKINTPLIYEVERKSTCWLMNSRKPSNWQVHQLIKLQSQEPINDLSHKLINLQTHKLINQSAHQPINLQTHNHISSSTHNLTKLNLLFLILQYRSNFRSVLAKM